MAGEVCLFVTYADEPRIKPHVLEHVAHLVGADIRVIVIVNTDLPAAGFTLDPALTAGARAASRCARTPATTSAPGPHAVALSGRRALDPALPRQRQHRRAAERRRLRADARAHPRLERRRRRAHRSLLAPRCGICRATSWSSTPAHCKAARCACSRACATGPRRFRVIDIYESRLTALLEAQGLRCEALFPSLSGDPLSSDDTSLRWAELVRAGFPYLKTRVIASHPGDPRIKAWLEARGAVSGGDAPS